MESEIENVNHTESANQWKVPVELDLVIDKSLSHGAFRLYLILRGYARTKKTAFPSEKTLANDLGCSERYIGRLKKELRGRGMLSWERREGKTNMYTLPQYKPIVPRTTVPNGHGTTVLYPQRTTVPSNNTNTNNTNIIMGQAHNNISRQRLSTRKKDFLVKFCTEYERLKGIPYLITGPAWNALQAVPDETVRVLLAAEAHCKAPRPGNVYWKCRGLIERWLTEDQGDWEEASDKGLAVFLKPDVLARFCKRENIFIEDACEDIRREDRREDIGSEEAILPPRCKAG